MIDNIKINDSELFLNLSELEQESVSGGLKLDDILGGFLLQATNTNSFGDSKVSLPHDIISTQKSGFNSSQFTLGFTINHGKDSFKFGPLQIGKALGLP